MKAWMEFTSLLVDSLVWPILVLVGVVLFRSQIGKLIDRVRSVQFNGKQVDFDKAIDDGLLAAKEQARKVDLPEEDTGVGMAMGPDRALWRIRKAQASTGDSPRGAIIESWVALERALGDACERLGLRKGHGRGPGARRAAVLMAGAGHFNAEFLRLLDQLRHLRNEAAHAVQFDIARPVAEEYVQLCLEAIRFLNRLDRSD